jgi:hypothetical protein
MGAHEPTLFARNQSFKDVNCSKWACKLNKISVFMWPDPQSQDTMDGDVRRKQEVKMDTYSVLRWGVVLVGAVLLLEAVRALVTGYTYGYYRSHVYHRRENAGRYFSWVVGRLGLGVLAIAAALMLG